MARRGKKWFIVVAAVMVAPATAFGAGFDDPVSSVTSQQFPTPLTPGNVQRQDTPNEPGYDRSEPDDETTGVPRASSLFEERFDLFGFPSALTTLTARYLDPQDPNFGKAQVSGFNAAGAWKVTRGLGSVDVAILDTGINWDSSGLRTKVRLNVAELPAPQPLTPAAPLGGYDLNGNGVVDVDDYKNDPRVKTATPTGQSLIKAFSDQTDADGNGYVDDIAGWDFFDDDNDPQDASSYFAARNHGTGRANEAVEKGNDGAGSIGVCPKCSYVPIRIWDTFVSDQNSFAMGVVYAADNGVEVIEGADGGLYHSAFAEAASQYAYDKGAAQLFSGNDLNTGNHNYPAAYDHVQLVQGVAGDNEGLGMDLPQQSGDPGIRDPLIKLLGTLGAGTQVPTSTYFRSANTTQFGGKSSISMQGPTGSTNTGKAAGAAALLISSARARGIALTPDETRGLLEQTAEDVLPGNTAGIGIPDPAQVGFDTHFGYGRVNLGKAVGAVVAGKIPPVASIASPDWYAPVTGPTVAIGGRASDQRHPGQAFTWKLEYGVGLAPTSFTTVRSASSSTPVTDFGTIDLAAVRAALAARTTFPDKNDTGGPVLDPAAKDPYDGQFTVRLVVTSAATGTLVGMDRHVLTALNDPTLKPGFPKKLGAGGEAPLRYADLNGDNVQELVLPVEDGTVHAYRPDGTELPGWPVRTQTQFAARAHAASPALKALDAPREVPRAVTIGDIDADGRPEILTTAGERIYAWNAKGQALPGFPINPDPDRANCAPSEQDKVGVGNHPKCGFLAAPALARLDGADKPQSIVAPGLDGRLNAYRADGSLQPGFPVRLTDTDVPARQRVTAESINNPAIGDLDGDGRDEIIAATNEVYGAADQAGGDVSFADTLANVAGTTSRVYAVKPTGTNATGGPFLPGWPIKPSGIIQNVLPLIGPGHDPSLVKVGGQPQVVVSVTGGNLALYGADGTKTRDLQQAANGALNLFESAAVGDVDGGGTADVVKYQIDLGQAANLLLVGQNVPYSHKINAIDAATGAPRPGFPVITDDYQFLSSSAVAKVAPGASNQVIAGTGLGLLHAYDGITGRDAPGFPKTTGGWLFAPAALSADNRIAAITREGFLFEWTAAGAPACQPEWPSFRHDEQGSGNYDADGTPPAAPADVAVVGLPDGRHRVTFTAPGDDRFCGTATRYVADVDGTTVDLGAPVAGGSAFSRDLLLPAGAKLTVRAADGPAAGRSNLGQPGSAAVPRAPAPSSGGAGGSSGTGQAGAPSTTGSAGSPTGTSSPSPGGTPGGPRAPTPNGGVCTSRRVITVTLKKAIRRRGVKRISVSVTGRKIYKLRRAGRTRVRVSLKGLPKGKVTVTLRVRGRDGKLRTDRRRYLACVSRAEAARLARRAGNRTALRRTRH